MVVTSLFQASFPGRHKANRIGRLLPGRSLRTIQRMLAGLTEPTASELLVMARGSQELRAEITRLVRNVDAEESRLETGAVVAEAGGATARPSLTVRLACLLARAADAVDPMQGGEEK